MKKQSRIVARRRQSASPAPRHLPLVDILIDTQAELQELVVASGLKVLEAMLEEDRAAVCGPRYAHQATRQAYRAGHAPSQVALGGRKVAIQRPDWVWGLGLMISGLFVAVAVIRYGPARFRQELIELEPSHVRLGRLYDWTITYLIPVQFAVMFGWWMYQAVVVYDPEAWWNPIRMYSVGTCVLQWGVVLVVLRLLNDRIAAASTRPA